MSGGARGAQALYYPKRPKIKEIIGHTGIPSEWMSMEFEVYWSNGDTSWVDWPTVSGDRLMPLLKDYIRENPEARLESLLPVDPDNPGKHKILEITNHDGTVDNLEDMQFEVYWSNHNENWVYWKTIKKMGLRHLLEDYIRANPEANLESLLTKL
jgi:hypothetical protein